MLNPLLLLLDRDGVINCDLPHGVSSVEAFQPLPGSLKAIADFKQAGFLVAVVSNQALVGRGELSLQGLEEIHYYLQEQLQLLGGQIDHFFVCTDIDSSSRRKPAPGMLLEAMTYFQRSCSQTLMIGDDRRDFEAAASAGCSFIQVRTGKGASLLEQTFLESLPADFVAVPLQHFQQSWQTNVSTNTKFLTIADDLAGIVPWLMPSLS